jgi:hypothetical protein
MLWNVGDFHESTRITYQKTLILINSWDVWDPKFHKDVCRNPTLKIYSRPILQNPQFLIKFFCVKIIPPFMLWHPITSVSFMLHQKKLCMQTDWPYFIRILNVVIEYFRDHFGNVDISILNLTLAYWRFFFSISHFPVTFFSIFSSQMARVTFRIISNSFTKRVICHIIWCCY